MELEFFGQPWADGRNLDDFFHEVSQQASPLELRIAVAWAKRSGMSRLRPYIDHFRERGGSVSLLTGISEGGATRQGLELALEICDTVDVFHDLSGRTFHPKVYMARTAEAETLFVGSNNATAGGTYFNYEAALVARFDPVEGTDNATLQQAHSWWDRLVGDPNCTVRLTAETLSQLLANPTYRIADEDKPGTHQIPGAPAEQELDVPDSDEGLFGATQNATKGARHGGFSRGVRGESGRRKAPSLDKSGTTRPDPVLRWSKRMKGTDAQQPPGLNSQATGNLRLAAARHQIDITTYFRNEFFGSAEWQDDPWVEQLEFAEIEADVYVNGESLGIMRFRVDHLLSRTARQNNVPTVLKWGLLASYLRQNNHVDDWVLLEKLSDGSFRLSIVDTDPGTR